MKISVFFVCICFALLATAQQAPIDSTYKLVVNEEFNGRHVNMALWDLKAPWNQSMHDSICICGCDGPNPTREQKAYEYWENDTHNIKINNGTATFFTRKEDYVGEFWDWPKDENGVSQFTITKHPVRFTTGLLYSRKKYYRGYYEIKFKLPEAPRFPNTYAPFGANFWVYDGDCWNEIDLYEIINGQQRTYTSNIHYELPPTMQGADTICDPLGARSPRHMQHHINLGSIADNEWHVASFDWQENQIVFYLDGKEYQRLTQDYIKYLEPMSIIVNINSPLYNACVGLNSFFVKYPYTYEVDYIKVWEAPKTR